MGRVALVLSVLAAGMIGSSSVGQPPMASEEPQSNMARNAKEAYLKELRKVDNDAAAAKMKLRDKYAKDLDDARKQALDKDNLDEAQRILTAKLVLTASNNDLSIPGRFQILQARFGIEGSWVDVTDEVQKLVRDGKLNMSLKQHPPRWPDPAFGKVKVLIVAYSAGGKVNVGIVGPPDFRAEFPELPMKK